MRLIDADLLYAQLQKDEELARKRVLDTESFLPYPNNQNPSYTRYLAQMDERTRLKHMIADAPTINLPRWITDKMPEETMPCLVTVRRKKYTTTNYYVAFDYFIKDEVEGHFRNCDNVIAWMPLPEVYGG